jgi:C4-type Zn-finger protein
MSAWKESFYEALAEYIRDNAYGSRDVAKVTSFEEETIESGYCETCYYESTEVWVYYEDSDGKAKKYEYYGNMAEFIRALTD